MEGDRGSENFLRIMTKICGFMIKLFWLKLPTALPATYFGLPPQVRILFLSNGSGPFLKEGLGRCSALYLRTQRRSPGGCDSWAEVAFCFLAWPAVALLLVLFKANFYIFIVPALPAERRRRAGSAGRAPPGALPRRPRAAPRSRWRRGPPVRRRGLRGQRGRWGGSGARSVLAPAPPRRRARPGPRWAARRAVTGSGGAGVHRVPLRGQRVPLPQLPGESPRRPSRGSGGSLAAIAEPREGWGALEEALAAPERPRALLSCVDSGSACTWSKVIPCLALKDEGVTK